MLCAASKSLCIIGVVACIQPLPIELHSMSTPSCDVCTFCGMIDTRFELVLPQSWLETDRKPVYIHLAGTGDHVIPPTSLIFLSICFLSLVVFLETKVYDCFTHAEIFRDRGS